MPVTTALQLRRARRGALAFLAALTLLAGVVPLGAMRADDSPPFAIFLDGLCSELASGQQFTANFAGDDGLPAGIVSVGFPADGVVGYSYRGGSVDPTGQWHPLPYTCADSRDQSLTTDVNALSAQIDSIATAHSRARFRLIGFSQGGLVAFAYLTRVTVSGDWTLPNGGTLEGVTTLDSPLGGVPFVDVLCGLAPDECGGRPTPAPGSTLTDMSHVWDSGAGHPAGGTRSIASDVTQARTTNQAIAVAAAAHGARTFTVGNVRDWLYAPAGPDAGTLSFLDTQWLTNEPDGVGVYARAIDDGPSACPSAAGDLAASYGCNHTLVLHDVDVSAGIIGAMGGDVPELSPACAPGLGECMALPPRPATIVSSSIAAGIVTGGGHFGTAAVSVKRGGRATILFTTTPAAAGRSVQIWGRSQTGAYRLMTTRLADTHGVVRYYTPPITAWAAIQARYPGDFVNGPGVSAGRVITVH